MKSHLLAFSLTGALFVGGPAFTGYSLVTNVYAANKSGSFSGMSGHKVSGGVTVSTSGGKTKITLSGNFRSQSGPDLYVYVGGASPKKRIGKLKKFKGSQTYTFSGTKPISHVHIYCKKFSSPFGRAKLR